MSGDRRDESSSGHPLDTGAWRSFDVNGLRTLYRGVRERAVEAGAFTADGFDIAVRAVLPPDPQPIDWVATAKEIQATCVKCGGSGVWWGDTRQFSGECFACGGTGMQDDSDRRRNWGYWTREGGEER